MYHSNEIKRKFFCFLIAGMLVVGLTACGNKNTDVNNTDDGMSVEILKPDNGDRIPVIPKNELEKDMTATLDGITFNKVMKLNGYEFMLGCGFDGFLEGTSAKYKESEEFENFKNRKGIDNCWVTCDINGSKFDVLVAHDSTDKIVVRGLVFDSLHTAIEEFGCNFEFLGVNVMQDKVSELKDDIEEMIVFDENKDTGCLKLVSGYEDRYVCVVDVETDGKGDYDFETIKIRGEQ